MDERTCTCTQQLTTSKHACPRTSDGVHMNPRCSGHTHMCPPPRPALAHLAARTFGQEMTLMGRYAQSSTSARCLLRLLLEKLAGTMLEMLPSAPST
eukprot:353695-Chlamydomonas_euryale.AAC.17